tara:strand:- start:265 stop:480 length:216 start_codon:yes stop_codon:yes gene_type:complete
MTYEESNAGITEGLTGRTIDYVSRSGKVLEIHTTCGHVIKLQADVEGSIQHKGTSVSIVMPSLSTMIEKGL